MMGRHVHYNPCLENPIDFTWEREWRIHQKYLYLDHEEVLVLVPNEEWGDMFVNRFDHEESIRYQWECLGYSSENARYPEELLYQIRLKDDL